MKGLFNSSKERACIKHPPVVDSVAPCVLRCGGCRQIRAGSESVCLHDPAASYSRHLSLDGGPKAARSETRGSKGVSLSFAPGPAATGRSSVPQQGLRSGPAGLAWPGHLHLTRRRQSRVRMSRPAIGARRRARLRPAGPHWRRPPAAGSGPVPYSRTGPTAPLRHWQEPPVTRLPAQCSAPGPGDAPETK